MNLTDLRLSMHKKLWQDIYQDNSLKLNTGDSYFHKVFNFNFVNTVWSGMVSQ